MTEQKEQWQSLGKFSSEADELVYQITLDGGCDQEVGDVQFGGWYGSVWFAPSDIPFLLALGVDSGYAIAHEDSQGFWYVDYYQHHGEWEDAWAKIVAAEEESDDEPHVGHFSRLGGTWWCDTCNSPYCDNA